MQTTDWPISDLPTFQSWLQEILSLQQIDAFSGEESSAGPMLFPPLSGSGSICSTPLRGPAMALRLIPQTILTMEQLNLRLSD